jgi:glycosyltransferase involved in cell wall biosynthesis
MNPKSIAVSIVIPAYNEVENINKGVLDEVFTYTQKQPWNTQILLIDDGSNDETAKYLEAYCIGKRNWRLIRNTHGGKALAVKSGVLAAQGKFVLFTDFDQATPLSEVEKLLPYLRKGYAIAIGSREVQGSRRENEPLYRHLMGRIWNLVVQLLAIPGIRDTQCGFKLFKREIAHELFQSLHVYADGEEREAYTGAFDVELLYIAQKRGYQIAEVPVHWKHMKTTRVSPLRDSVRMLSDLVRVRIADLQGKYDR